MSVPNVVPFVEQYGPVLLTSIAYTEAQRAGVASVQQNNDRVELIRKVTRVPETFIPDLTVVRWNTGFDPTRWDQLFQSAPDNFAYYPAGEIPETGFDEATVVSARQVRAALHAGVTLIELTVRTWDGWGKNLAEAFFDAKEAGDALSPGDALRRASTAVGAVVGGVLGIPLTQRASIIKASGALQPYSITRHERPAITDGQ